MRHNLTTAITLIMTYCALIIFTGCEEKTQTAQQTQTTANVSSKTKTPPPALKFEETALDFGKVGPGTVTIKELKFQNTGEGILKITEISQCCGIVAKLDKEQYEPGEKGILKIEFQASGTIGILERKPEVFSNDPDNPIIILSVKAEIVQKVAWEPEKIKLLLNVENAACPKLTIKSLDGKEFAITGIRSTGNCVTAEYNPTVKKVQHILDLKVNMEKLPSQLNGEISVIMNHPEGSLATVFFDVVPKYTTSPKSLFLFNMKKNEPETKTIKLINNYKEAVEIESTSSKEKLIKLIDNKKINDDFELNIEITPPPVAGTERRFKDIFYINLKGGEQIAMECTGYYED